MKQKQLLVSIISGLLLVACGSDDDESSSPAVEAPEYTGLETEATISTENAESIVREMFGLGGVVASPTEDETADPKPEPYNIQVPLALAETIERIDTENSSDTATAEKNLNVVSYCEEDQGVIDYNITIDDLTGAFNGSMNYRDCLISDFSLNGSADVQGNYDLLNDIFLEINLDFLWLRADTETISYAAAGAISIEFADLITTTTLRDYAVTIEDKPVVKFDDYAITVTDDTLVETLTLSGIFYHPDYGYVTVSTDGSIEFTPDITWPYFGALNMDGDSSSLRILCEDSAQYTLWVDEDGDGTYESVTIVSWL